MQEVKKQWDETRREYVARYKSCARLALLKSLVPNLLCPNCKTLKLKSKSWVVLNEATRPEKTRNEQQNENPHRLLITKLFIARRALCKSCYIKYVK